MARGLNNNNPGNIRIGGAKFIGEKDKSTDKSFRQFISMPFGYRAMFVLLRNYIKNGNNTIFKMINTWAPPSENATSVYVTTVEKNSGIDKHKIITVNDLDSLTKIISGMSAVENGISAILADIIKGRNLLESSVAVAELKKKAGQS